MIDKVNEFFEVCEKYGVNIAIYQTLSYFTFGMDFQNAIRFRDPRIAFSCDIKQLLPKGTTMQHPVGIVISDKAEIGDNVTILQNVTIGSKLHPQDQNLRAPQIADDVTIYSGALVVGDIHIGRGAVIGANLVVLDDVSENSTVAGAPAVPVTSE